ncbi:hypothetical protein JVX96_24350 [Variovorax sp. PDNC026]|uniref:hypothetical protein n=1 Tax=Variovorax sp. PDNC026 TaxID=2811425 RepID=UPI0019640531|nr:hypothetical protein [Variovorax sp. PDNC026]QRY31179.1 hypothetical protein JVX96_24350 [Variovorax sp. PDNC026]
MDKNQLNQFLLKAQQDPETAKQLAEIMKRVVEAYDRARPAVQLVAERFAAMLEKIQPALQELQKWWIEFHPNLVRLVEAAKAMPPAYRKALMELGQRGWYLDGEMGLSTPFEFARAISEGQIEDTEVALEDHFTMRLDAIESEIAAAFPSRARILAAAFRAHKDGLYACSIPVFLTQMDGICMEVGNKYFFIRENRRPGIAGHIDQLSDNPLTAAMLAPLTEILPISAGPDARGPGFWQLNRHTVIHGESVDYDTRRNSLRAISLINYVSQMLSQPKLASIQPPSVTP